MNGALVQKPDDDATLGSGAMFDRIAARYDFVNRVLSLGLDQGWRRRTVRELHLGDAPRVLDVATGTGDLAIAIAKMHPGATVVGLDPSAKMLAVAAQKIARRGGSIDTPRRPAAPLHTPAKPGLAIELREGDAQALPFASCSFDAATIAFGIRNVPDRPRALREMARVVRPGGRIAVLELGEPRSGLLSRAARFHTRHVVPRLGALLSGAREYRYLQTSVAAFPPADEFARMMIASGLAVAAVIPLTFGACTLYVATPAEVA